MQKRTWMMMIATVLGLIVAVSVLGVPSAHDRGLPTVVVDPESLRDGSLQGDREALDEAEERSGSWRRFSGRLVYSRDGSSPSEFPFAIWDGGYYWGERKTGIYEAGIGRVGATSLATGKIEVTDSRFEPCPEQRALGGRTLMIGGVPAFEPREDEWNFFTNNDTINRLVAPASWIRADLERLGRTVEDLGTEVVADRPARKLRVVMGERDEPTVSDTIVTIWVDEQYGVVLREIEEGVDDTGTEREPFHQEWRFEDVAFDDDVEPLRLSDLPISKTQDQVLYRAYLGSPDEKVEQRVSVTDGMTVQSLVEMASPESSDHPMIEDCGAR